MPRLAGIGRNIGMPDLVIADPEGVGDTSDLSSVVEHDQIKTQMIAGPFGMLCQQDRGCRQQPVALGWRQGGRGVA